MTTTTTSLQWSYDLITAHTNPVNGILILVREIMISTRDLGQRIS